MPEMSGLDFLSQLRSERQDIPVILMTGFPSVPTAVSAISLGAAGYVTKPFTPEEISQAVHRFANQGRTAPTEASQRVMKRWRTRSRPPVLHGSSGTMPG